MIIGAVKKFWNRLFTPNALFTATAVSELPKLKMKSVYIFLAAALMHVYIASTALQYNAIAQISQGSVFVAILMYNYYSLWKQIMPCFLFLVLSMAILVMMSLIFIGTILIVLHLTVSTSDPTLMLIDKIVQQFEQAFFFGILFQIDCEVLRLFSVLNPKITDHRINLLRNIWLSVYSVGCVLIFAAYWGLISKSLSPALSIAFGGPVLLFDITVSIYMLYKLVRLKRASVETPHVTEAICVISMMVFMALFGIYSISGDGPSLSELTDTQYVCVTVQIASLFCIQYGLAVELFTHVRMIAISKSSARKLQEQPNSKPTGSPTIMASTKTNASTNQAEKDTVRM